VFLKIFPEALPLRGPASSLRLGLFLYRSRFSFRFPQCVSFRSGLNCRTSLRWIACRTPIRAIIVGKPRSAAKVSISAAVVTAGMSRSDLGTVLARYATASRSVLRRVPSGVSIGSSNLRDQDTLGPSELQRQRQLNANLAAELTLDEVLETFRNFPVMGAGLTLQIAGDVF
jgi:hypothetical protein